MKNALLYCLLLVSGYWSGAQNVVRASRFEINRSSDNYLHAIGNSRNHHLIGTYPGWDAEAVYVAGYNNSFVSWAATKRVFIGRTFKFDLLTNILTAPAISLNKTSDNVLTSTGNGQNHHLIGTYPGWDVDGVYIAGYNNSFHAPASTKRVYIGRTFKFDLINNSLAIGTTTSGSHKLAVEGSIGAREVKVEASGWSDFVFEPGYSLPTLEEVEQHIAEKGHLPEIPSEAEVTENGINLGEMNAKLLQKIEELTLYLIEQNKRMSNLEARNAALEKKKATFKNQ